MYDRMTAYRKEQRKTSKLVEYEFFYRKEAVLIHFDPELFFGGDRISLCLEDLLSASRPNIHPEKIAPDGSPGVRRWTKGIDFSS